LKSVGDQRALPLRGLKTAGVIAKIARKAPEISAPCRYVAPKLRCHRQDCSKSAGDQRALPLRGLKTAGVIAKIARKAPESPPVRRCNAARASVNAGDRPESLWVAVAGEAH